MADAAPRSGLDNMLGGGRNARFGTIAIAAAIVLALLLGASSWMAVRAADAIGAASAWERHTVRVLGLTGGLRVTVLDTWRSQRDYLLTEDATLLDAYVQDEEETRSSVKEIAALIAHNKSQSAHFAYIGELIDHILGLTGSQIAMVQGGRREAAVEEVRENVGRAAIIDMIDELDAFERTERELLAGRTALAREAERRSRQLVYVLSVVGLTVLGLASLAAFGLRRSLLREEAIRAELHRRASTDELTGLANRRELLQSLDRMIASARRSGRPLSVAILDIDHFKRVNDRHGHPAGDEVICHVAQLAVDIMRDQDLVGRLGGEEFVVALPDSDLSSAFSACERLRKAMADRPIVLKSGLVLSITVSAGIARLKDSDDRTMIIARADEALYQAKDEGRDTVKMAA